MQFYAKKANLCPEFLVIQGQFVGHVIQFLLGGLGKGGAVAPQGRKGGKNLRTGLHAHAGVFHEKVPVVPRVGQIYYVGIVAMHGVLRFVRSALRWWPLPAGPCP